MIAITPAAAISPIPSTESISGTSLKKTYPQKAAHIPSQRDMRQIDRALRVNHSHLAIAAAIDGQRVALVSTILAGNTIQTGHLVPLHAIWRKTGHGYHIIAASKTPGRKVTDFAAWMAQTLDAVTAVQR